MTANDRILITGGAGFIGSHIADAVVAEGRSTIVLDDLSTGRRPNIPAAAQFEELDLAMPGTEGIVSRLRPTVIVHCAAQTSVPASFRDPAADARANAIASLNVIRGALSAGTRRFVYLTTGGALYGRPVAIPCREDHPINPLSPYGWTKYLVEGYLDLLANTNMSWIALRLANVYGPRQRTNGEGAVVATFAEAMAARQPVVIHGDGKQTRDFVYVTDVVDAVVAALDTEVGGAVNIGTGIGTSVSSLFAILASISGYALQPSYGAARHGDIRHSVLDTMLARTQLGWGSRVSIEEGLRLTYAALIGDANSASY